ncbi:unnamed protein product, partial [Allacma fusca]
VATSNGSKNKTILLLDYSFTVKTLNNYCSVFKELVPIS